MIGKATLWNRERIVPALLTGAVLAAAAVALLLLIASNSSSETAAVEEDSGPATVENIEGSELRHVILTEEAAERLGIETAPITETDVASAGVEGGTVSQKSVPYSAVLYDLNGGAFVYTSPEPLTFVRAPITVDRIVGGETAILLDGPDTGTAVVTVGGAELFGAEFEFEE